VYFDFRTPYALTRRQREVLVFIASGLTSSMIARVLRLSPATIGGHRITLGEKLDLPGRLTWKKASEIIGHILRKTERPGRGPTRKAKTAGTRRMHR
jgi:DNA-binding CsgD family transcriptional regulator